MQMFPKRRALPNEGARAGRKATLATTPTWLANWRLVLFRRTSLSDATDCWPLQLQIGRK